MAKVEKIIEGVKITVITSHSSALGYFNFKDKQYKSTIKGKLIEPQDIVDLIISAEVKVKELVNEGKVVETSV